MRKGDLVRDDIDVRLLDALQSDADRTLRELGDQVGLSPSAVQRRITRYKNAGLIRTVAVVDPTHLDAVQALVMLTLVEETHDNHRQLADRLQIRNEVQHCYVLSGRWDYAVVLTAPDLPGMRRLCNELFKQDPNIRRYDTMFLLDSIKTNGAIAAELIVRS